MAKARKRTRGQRKVIISPFKNYWTKENLYILILGFVILIVGFILMDQGPWDNPISRTASPIVLLIGYLVVFPFAILYRKNKKDNQDNVSG